MANRCAGRWPEYAMRHADIDFDRPEFLEYSSARESRHAFAVEPYRSQQPDRQAAAFVTRAARLAGRLPAIGLAQGRSRHNDSAARMPAADSAEESQAGSIFQVPPRIRRADTSRSPTCSRQSLMPSARPRAEHVEEDIPHYSMTLDFTAAAMAQRGVGFYYRRHGGTLQKRALRQMRAPDIRLILMIRSTTGSATSREASVYTGMKRGRLMLLS